VREPNDGILADMIAVRAEKQPDLDVVTFENGFDQPTEVRTYADLFDNGHRIAGELITRGMAPGDRFALIMRNHPEFIDTMVAASITGTVFVPIDPRTKGEKLAYTLNNSVCKGIVCADYALPFIEEIRARLPALEWLLVLESGEGEGLPDTAAINDAAPIGEILARPAKTIDVRLETGAEPLEIMYTSGTTGDPKGVVLSNLRYGMAAKGMGQGFRVGYDRPYTGLSLTHGNAQMITLASTLGMGLRAVISRRFTKSRLFDITRKYGCTVFNLLGGMSTAVYAEPERPDDADNPVEFVISAGMPATIWEKFEQRFDLRIKEFYGAVEGGLAMKPIDIGPVGSFGKPPRGLEMIIVDDNDDECPPGVLGELISRPMKGPAPSVEYFGNHKASSDKTRDGWLRSGDICHQDADGWFFFDYRKGGGIRRNGDFINPGFVEQAIAEHPAITDVFVYGVEAASGAPGERDVVAAIVPTDIGAFDAASVFRICRQDLEANFVPSYLQVVDEIPKTASEKPQERFLLERFTPDGEGIFQEASS
jgi:carnitine-CoA ligase